MRIPHLDDLDHLNLGKAVSRERLENGLVFLAAARRLRTHPLMITLMMTRRNDLWLWWQDRPKLHAGPAGGHDFDGNYDYNFDNDEYNFDNNDYNFDNFDNNFDDNDDFDNDDYNDDNDST